MENTKIWYGSPTVESIEWMNAKTIAESLNIRVTEIGNDYIKGTMPVDGRQNSLSDSFMAVHPLLGPKL